MRRTGFALAGFLAAACASTRPQIQRAATALPPATMAAAQEIMRLEESWARALSSRDTAFFRETLADDFVGTGGADVRSKSELIADLAGSTGTAPVPRLEKTQVRVFDDMAIVTGIAVYQATAGVPGSRTRFTEVWIKREGRWQAVHGHYNPVAER